MKKLFIAFLFLSSNVTAQSIDSLFVNANVLYKAGEYEQAISLYETIVKDKLQAEAVYFNLANCYYKLNAIAPAIYNYEKVLKLNPHNTAAKTNLTFANRMKIDAIKNLPKTFFQKTAESTYKKWSSNTWSIIAICSSFLILLSFLLYYFNYDSTKKLLFFNVLIFAILALLLSTFFAYKNYQSKGSIKQAIVFAKEANLKEAPTNSSETVFELHEGTKVILLDTKDDWTKIKLADGKTGWITQERIKEF